MTATLVSLAEGTPYLVPTQPENQEFDISLAGTTYHLIIKWNNFSNCWIMDIQDDQGDNILMGTPLVTGCDLLEQFASLDIDGAMVVQSTNDPDLVPDYETLGSTGNLFFITPPTS